MAIADNKGFPLSALGLYGFAYYGAIPRFVMTRNVKFPEIIVGRNGKNWEKRSKKLEKQTFDFQQ
jgi:hypothetical protein